MEYEGAGSFWAQLSTAPGAADISAFAPRRIDELLRNSESSLLDILSDDEAISEFRSSNANIITRLTDIHGMTLLVNLVTNQGLSSEMTEVQKLHLPFVAAELVACEVDSMLDSFSRIVPGHQTPLDRLLDYLLTSSEASPTVNGYVVRVVSLLISKRSVVMDKCISDRLPGICAQLTSKVSDRSVAELIARLLTDDDVKSFVSGFNILDLIAEVGKGDMSVDENVLWILDSIFCRAVGQERLELIWSKVVADPASLDRLSDQTVTSSPTGLSILEVVLGFAFRPAAFSKLSTPEVRGWETFGPSSKSSKPDEDDSCLFDDEEPREVTSDPAPPNADWGNGLIEKLVVNYMSGQQDALLSESLSNLGLAVPLISLLGKIVLWSGGPKSLPAEFSLFVSSLCSECLFAFPSSSGLHNVVVACLTTSDHFTHRAPFIALACKYLRSVEQVARPGGCYGHVCRVLAKWGCSETDVCSADAELVQKAIAYWARTDMRLADVRTTVVSLASPKGATPIIDTGEWASMDFAAFPKPDSENDI